MHLVMVFAVASAVDSSFEDVAVDPSYTYEDRVDEPYAMVPDVGTFDAPSSVAYCRVVVDVGNCCLA